ncbi:hypothetical protein [Streptomyces antimicrobicus]|uniref:Uncharacterized protein n=1 Tax=Streptomyces antimicrobicus TaxID=2883108 RepID=A0ABS8B8S6_9ACTN|nr:hypothetical protein [Streptomyces antimicrobicus]MCB5181026.1 hypothetical protein [Streptomyces antimicrobicus]
MASSSHPSRNGPLAGVLGLVCFVLVVGGACGLLHEWLGPIPFMGFGRYLAPAGYEVVSYVVMISLGFAAGAASEAAGRKEL